MTVILDTSGDLTLESLQQISRDGASCAVSGPALDRVARRREEFVVFVQHNEDRHLYTITTKHHMGAKTMLDAASRDEFARACRQRRPGSASHSGPSTGDGLPGGGTPGEPRSLSQPVTHQRH